MILADVQAVVKYIRNWSVSGRDTVYNFWLNYLTSSHLHPVRRSTAVLRNPKIAKLCSATKNSVEPESV